MSTLHCAFLAWALPFVWGALTYGLSHVAQRMQPGRIAVFDAPIARICSPAHCEVQPIWFTVFLHSGVGVEAARAGNKPAFLESLAE